MTAATVCKRMLFTLWKLHAEDSTSGLMEPGSRLLPRRLEPCLLQLGPKFARGEGMITLVATVSIGVDNAELYVPQSQQRLVRVAGQWRGVVYTAE